MGKKNQHHLNIELLLKNREAGHQGNAIIQEERNPENSFLQWAV